MTQMVIIGGGQAAGQAVASLRQEGFDGKIVLIGEESTLPYQRPPLSKAYLSGAVTAEKLLVRPEKFYADRDVEVHLGTSVTAMGRNVTVYLSQAIPAGSAVVLTLPLPGHDVNNAIM